MPRRVSATIKSKTENADLKNSASVTTVRKKERKREKTNEKEPVVEEEPKAVSLKKRSRTDSSASKQSLAESVSNEQSNRDDPIPPGTIVLARVDKLSPADLVVMCKIGGGLEKRILASIDVTQIQVGWSPPVFFSSLFDLRFPTSRMIGAKCPQ